MKNTEYFVCNKTMWKANDGYMVKFSDELYQLIGKPQKQCPGFTYHWFIIKLFGLEPNQYFNYIQAVYNAKIIRTGIHKVVYFSSLSDAIKFKAACNTQLQKCLEAGYFGEQIHSDTGTITAN